MNWYTPKKLHYTYLTALLLLVWSCANIVPPVGGQKDTTPPELLSIIPSDSSLNIRPNKIIATFNKYMEVGDLTTQMSVSPMLPMNPTVLSLGKKIQIKLADSMLQPNTTYKISFGNAITDNRENTPYADFSYIFSTGTYFDSLMYAGRVINAQTGAPDSGIMVALYDVAVNDSAILTQKPLYTTRANAQGFFQLDLLPNKPFKLFVIADEDNNYVYNYMKERVGFLPEPIQPVSESQTSTIVYSFLEKNTSDTVNQKVPAATGLKSKSSSRNKKEATVYQVKVDTSNLKVRSFDVTEGLTIDFPNSILPNIDYQKVYLSYDDNGIDVESIYKIDSSQNSQLILQPTWKEDATYTLRLVKGWARDSAGVELPPGRYKFRTKNKDDYATLTINVPDSVVNANYVMQISLGEDSIYTAKITANKVTLKYLTPGSYQLQLIADRNDDGKWTTGDVFLKRLPELVLPHESTIILRSSWDNEVDYKLKPLQGNVNNESKANVSKPKFEKSN